MTEADLRAVFIEEVVRIAPDLDAAAIGPDDDLQEDLGLDSMDIVALVSALHRRLGLAIPEADYPRLATPARAAAYLAARRAE